jgi:hypothetical protein
VLAEVFRRGAGHLGNISHYPPSFRNEEGSLSAANIWEIFGCSAMLCSVLRLGPGQLCSAGSNHRREMAVLHMFIGMAEGNQD